jgi:hypothetical protein
MTSVHARHAGSKTFKQEAAVSDNGRCSAIHRKRLTIAAVKGYVVHTAGSIALAPVYFGLKIICSTIFDSWLRNWEWHKGKKHRHQHPHLNLILLLPKPVDA